MRRQPSTTAPPIQASPVMSRLSEGGGGEDLTRQPSQSQAMADIDASVMKLLISTKQLLEVVTQWSRLEANEKQVSDIYVVLGNEFNKVTVMFQNAGIDMSDLSSVPMDLRHILENALGEDPSPGNLDKFLPRLRETIINLLTGMKRKQQIHRVKLGQAPVPPRSARKQSSPSVQPSASGSAAPGFATPRLPPAGRQRSISPTPEPVARGGRSVSGTTDRTGASMSASQVSMPNTSSSIHSQLSEKASSQGRRGSGSRDPAAQLKEMRPERRSSKRLSENYMAQLTSGGPDTSPRLSVDGVRRTIYKTVSGLEPIDDEADEQQQQQQQQQQQRRQSTRSSPPSDAGQSQASVKNGTITPRTSVSTHAVRRFDTKTLFIRRGKVTKKCILSGDIDGRKLTELINEAFGEMPTGALEIEDRETKTVYELEDFADIVDRTVLIVPMPTEPEVIAKSTALDTGLLDSVKAMLDERLTAQAKTIDDFKAEMGEKLAKLPSAPAPSSAARSVESDDRHKALQTELAGVKSELAVLSKTKADLEGRLETHTTAKGELESSLQERDVKLKDFGTRHEDLIKENARMTQRVADLEARLASKPTDALHSPIMTSHEHVTSPKQDASAAAIPEHAVERIRVLKLSARQEQAVTSLTARIDEHLNTLQRVKKDVLQRKVSPHPQLLADLTATFDDLVDGTEQLRHALSKLDAVSQKLWESELTTITTEQQALEYQGAMIDDMRADLDEWRAVLENIKDLEVQRRALPGAAATDGAPADPAAAAAAQPLTGQPVVIETAGDPTKHHKFLQQDIKGLQVNHEARALAIEQAERLREKDKQYLVSDPFAKELGDFVGNTRFKNRGMAPDLDRRRSEKEDLIRLHLYKSAKGVQSGSPVPDAQADGGEADAAATARELPMGANGTDGGAQQQMPMRRSPSGQRAALGLNGSSTSSSNGHTASSGSGMSTGQSAAEPAAEREVSASSFTTAPSRTSSPLAGVSVTRQSLGLADDDTDNGSASERGDSAGSAIGSSGSAMGSGGSGVAAGGAPGAAGEDAALDALVKARQSRRSQRISIAAAPTPLQAGIPTADQNAGAVPGAAAAAAAGGQATTAGATQLLAKIDAMEKRHSSGPPA